jgi:hypothetical protein
MAIIYEPPGSQSYAKLTGAASTGIGISVKVTDSSSTETIDDPGALGTGPKSDVQQTAASESSSVQQLTLTQTSQYGTANAPGKSSGGLRGPGEGDTYILSISRPLIMWDADGLANYTLAPDDFTDFGSPQDIAVVYAGDLASGDPTRLPPGLAAALQVEPDILHRLLSLDPFADKSRPLVQHPRDPRWLVQELDFARFAPLVQIWELSANEQVVQTDSAALVSTVALQKASGLGGKDTNKTNADFSFLASLAVAGVAYGAGGFVGAAVAAAGAAALKGLGLDKKAEEAIRSTFTAGSTTTTVTHMLTQTRSISHVDSAAVTQEFRIGDTNPIAVAAFYDRLFGTIAFVEAHPAQGWAIREARRLVEEARLLVQEARKSQPTP